jgi:GH15 family glucan-1,4-alpha-glucosidase
MCWVALSRAVDIAAQLNAQHRAPEWAAVRDEIRAAILERGWSPGDDPG